jgi:hypothetical protein
LGPERTSGSPFFPNGGASHLGPASFLPISPARISTVHPP